MKFHKKFPAAPEPLMIFCNSLLADTILQPSSTMFSNSTNNNAPAEPAKKPMVIGSTWSNAGNINIDFDNLISKKTTKGPAPSMNQLKSATTSPVKAANNANVMLSQSNNNNFSNFNAFQ